MALRASSRLPVGMSRTIVDVSEAHNSVRRGVWFESRSALSHCSEPIQHYTTKQIRWQQANQRFAPYPLQAPFDL
jgi:hypothetical protein